MLIGTGTRIAEVAARQRRGISLQKIYSKYNWRNMWSGENGTDDGTTLTAIDYTGNDHLSNPALTNKPTLTYLNGKGAVQYDGVDDYLIKSVTNWRKTDTEGQVIAVIRTPSSWTGLAETVFATNSSSRDDVKAAFYLKSGELQFVVQDVPSAGFNNHFSFGTVATDTNYIVTIKSNGTSYEFTLNGVVQTITVIAGANDGKWLSSIISNTNQIAAGALIQPTARYGAVTVGFTGYAPSAEPTLDIVNDLNSYYQVF
jgi:hypothetical protein